MIFNHGIYNISPVKENNLRLFIVDKEKETGGGGGTPFPSFIVITSAFCVAAVTYGVIRKVRK